MTYQNSITYSITTPIYTSKEISNLRMHPVVGHVEGAGLDEGKIHIPNLVFMYKNALCSIDKTFSTAQDGSNGIFAMYSTAYSPNELTPFDNITLNEIKEMSGCISGEPISLTKILKCIDYIFYSWMTNIKTVCVQFDICHSNCHSNRYGLNSSRMVCVCGRWETIDTVKDMSTDTPINITPPLDPGGSLSPLDGGDDGE